MFQLEKGQELKRLAVSDGDLLVLKCPEPLSAEKISELHAILRKHLASIGLGNVKAMVLAGGCDLTLIKREDQAA